MEQATLLSLLRFYGSEYNSGVSYVLFGGKQSGNNGVFELSSLNGLNGFVINAIAYGEMHDDYDHNSNSGSYMGGAVSYAGDVNHDGVDDVIIGAHRANSQAVSGGAWYILFGRKNIGIRWWQKCYSSYLPV